MCVFLVRVHRLGTLDAEALLRHPEAEARAAVRLPHLADPLAAAVLARVQAPASVRDLAQPQLVLVKLGEGEALAVRWRWR